MTLFSYGTLASHFAQNKNFEYFAKILEQMERDGIKQSLVMSNILLGMCKKANRIDKTLKTLTLIDKANMQHDNINFISLINDLV